MKRVFTFLLVFSALTLHAQDKPFLLDVRVVNELNEPVPDVYVVNMNSHEVDLSNEIGVFSVWVTPGDSLVLSHISYYRKVAKVYHLLLNPVVMLFSQNVDIPEIRVTSSVNALSDEERAEINIKTIQAYKPIVLERMHYESDPVRDMMTANNSVLRSEASSIHLISFSPSQTLSILYSKFKRKDPLTNYSSTRKVVKPPTENEEEQE